MPFSPRYFFAGSIAHLAPKIVTLAAAATFGAQSCRRNFTAESIDEFSYRSFLNPLQNSLSHQACSIMPFDRLTASASDLQALMETGLLTSTDLVLEYLDQIETHNLKGMGLHAIISTASKEYLLARAHELDQERANNKIRGPLHGIPIIVKDTISTGMEMGMETSCGTLALKQAGRNAVVIDLVISAGMIVLGKANVDELAGNKGYGCIAGWSAKGGLTRSPYVRGGVLDNATFLGHSTAGGSSCGSAVGVAAGFSPLSLGTETDGSLVQPATRAGLYALKPSVGNVDGTGVMPVSPSFDAVGTMAKTVTDLTHLTNVIMGGKGRGFSTAEVWSSFKVGFVDPEIWQAAPIAVEPNEDFKKQTLAAMEKAMQTIEALGGNVTRNVGLVTLQSLQDLGDKVEIEDLIDFEFKKAFEAFLSTYAETSARSVQELIDFNLAHAEEELPPRCPDQDCLLAVLKDNMTVEQFTRRLDLMRKTALDNIQTLVGKHSLDIILAPADARMASIASIIGFAHGAVPLGYADFNGRPFGLNVLATTKGEDKILAFMGAWEATFPEARKPPPMLVHWKDAE